MKQHFERTTMAQQSFGSIISTLRKQKGMTQLDLAQKMGVTDKAVSKWERDLSFPDVATLPKLALELDTSVDGLLEAKTSSLAEKPKSKAPALIELTLKAVALAMGVGVLVISLMDKGEPRSMFCLLGIGLACLALVHIAHTDDREL